MIRRRDFLTGAAAVAAYGQLAHAQSITPQIGGGISQGFDGGIGGGGGLAPYTGFVATGAKAPSTFLGSIHFLNSRKRHFTRVNVTNPKIQIPNFYALAPNEGGPGGSQTFTASIEYPIGTFTQATFGGLVTGTATDKSILTSDAVPVTIPINTAFFVRIFGTLPFGMCYMNSTNKDQDTTNGEALQYSGTTLTDLTMGGTVPSTDTVNMFGPCGIIASTTAPSVLIIGDSISAGSFDLPDGSTDYGIIARPLGPFFGYSNMGLGSDTLGFFAAGNYPLRYSQRQFASHIVLQLGINDVKTNTLTLLQLQTLVNNVVAMFPGKQVLVTTTTPDTTGGTFPAGTGQTTQAFEATRTAWNDWKRGVPAGILACLETADTYETNTPGSATTVRNGGIYKLNSSQDGLHPIGSQSAGYPASTANGSAFAAFIHRP